MCSSCTINEKISRREDNEGQANFHLLDKERVSISSLTSGTICTRKYDHEIENTIIIIKRIITIIFCSLTPTSTCVSLIVRNWLVVLIYSFVLSQTFYLLSNSFILILNFILNTQVSQHIFALLFIIISGQRYIFLRNISV